MNTSTTCPDCGEDLRFGAQRCSCGWKAAGASTADPSRWQCADIERGQRCAERGGFTPNMRGPANGIGPHPGPFYCWKHARFVHGGDPGGYAAGKRRVPPGVFDALRALTKAAPRAPAPLDVESELERMAIQREGVE